MSAAGITCVAERRGAPSAVMSFFREDAPGEPSHFHSSPRKVSAGHAPAGRRFSHRLAPHGLPVVSSVDLQ